MAGGLVEEREASWGEESAAALAGGLAGPSVKGSVQKRGEGWEAAWVALLAWV